MKKNYTKGFTLIELLVVIAIIGILSSVVLTSLNSARDKGINASTKGSLSSIRSQAEISYDSSNNSYANVCSDSQIAKALNAIVKNGGFALNTASTTGSSNTVTCHAATTAWAAEAPLKGLSNFFCVDSTGQATTTSGSTLVANDTVCG